MGAKAIKVSLEIILPLLPWAGGLLAEPDRRETYLPKILQPQNEMEWKGKTSWRSHTKTSFFLALRIGAEILLSRRGKRLERKPDPPKGNAIIRIMYDVPVSREVSFPS